MARAWGSVSEIWTREDLKDAMSAISNTIEVLNEQRQTLSCELSHLDIEHSRLSRQMEKMLSEVNELGKRRDGAVEATQAQPYASDEFKKRNTEEIEEKYRNRIREALKGFNSAQTSAEQLQKRMDKIKNELTKYATLPQTEKEFKSLQANISRLNLESAGELQIFRKRALEIMTQLEMEGYQTKLRKKETKSW